MSRLFVGLTVLTLLAGVSTTAAPVPVHLMPKEPPLYFPTRVGAKWVYQYGEEGRHGVFGEILLTLSVTAVERTDRGVLVTVTRHEPNGESFLDQKVLVSVIGRGAGATRSFARGAAGGSPPATRVPWWATTASRSAMHSRESQMVTPVGRSRAEIMALPPQVLSLVQLVYSRSVGHYHTALE